MLWIVAVLAALALTGWCAVEDCLAYFDRAPW